MLATRAKFTFMFLWKRGLDFITALTVISYHNPSHPWQWGGAPRGPTGVQFGNWRAHRYGPGPGAGVGDGYVGLGNSKQPYYAAGQQLPEYQPVAAVPAPVQWPRPDPSGFGPQPAAQYGKIFLHWVGQSGQVWFWLWVVWSAVVWVGGLRFLFSSVCTHFGLYSFTVGVILEKILSESTSIFPLTGSHVTPSAHPHQSHKEYQNNWVVFRLSDVPNYVVSHVQQNYIKLFALKNCLHKIWHVLKNSVFYYQTLL